MASKTTKTIWYCPCNCTTPKGLHKNFFKINTLIEHLISEHSDIIETKFLYRKSDKNSSTNKKRTHDDYEEDGFKELLSVEEEVEFRQSDEDINDLSNATASMHWETAVTKNKIAQGLQNCTEGLQVMYIVTKKCL